MEEAKPENQFNEEPVQKDKSLLYMGIGLAAVILIMGYLTLFVDNVGELFSDKPEVVKVYDDNSGALSENTGMSDSEIRSSLIKFIEAFYSDQRKGYFDPPSYFAPITETYYNYHNLTYKRLKEVYYKRASEMQDFKLQWIVSSLDFDRSGVDLVATYWTKVSYNRPSINKEESADVKFELVINPEGKIVSLREAEIKNQIVYQLPEIQDSIQGEETGYQEAADPTPDRPVSPPVGQNTESVANPDARYEGKLYDLGSVETAPEYQGGSKALARYIGSALRYPIRAKENKVQGKVYIGFVVEKNGSLTDFRIVRGIGSGCDEEAVRVLKASPAWKAGTVEGKAVRTSYILPITYQLAD